MGKAAVGMCVAAALVVGMTSWASAQEVVPVITYYSGPVTVYYPATPAVVYSPAPTVVYRPTVAAPATVVQAPVVYRPPSATVVYRPGPLGIFMWRDVYYTPGQYVAPTAVFYAPGVVYPSP